MGAGSGRWLADKGLHGPASTALARPLTQVERPLEASLQLAPPSAQRHPNVGFSNSEQSLLCSEGPQQGGGEPRDQGSRFFFLLASLTSLPLLVPFPSLACPFLFKNPSRVNSSPTSSRKTCLVTPSPKSCSMALGANGGLRDSRALLSSPVHPPCCTKRFFRDTGDLVTHFLQILTTLRHGMKTIANSGPTLSV